MVSQLPALDSEAASIFLHLGTNRSDRLALHPWVFPSRSMSPVFHSSRVVLRAGLARGRRFGVYAPVALKRHRAWLRGATAVVLPRAEADGGTRRDIRIKRELAAGSSFGDHEGQSG